jgi:hypothetical protein
MAVELSLFSGEPEEVAALQRMIEAQIHQWRWIRTIRLAVVATNAQVLPFWYRMGFTETGEVRPYRHGKLRSESIILDKPLRRPGA